MVEASGVCDRETDSVAVKEASKSAYDKWVEETKENFRFVNLQVLEIHQTPDRGYGVFTSVVWETGEEIGQNPGLFIPSDSEVLDSYAYEYDDRHVLAMGFFSYLNHSNNANCAYYIDIIDGRPIVFLEAVQDIALGEELTINYNGQPDDPTLWNFEINKLEGSDA